MVKLGQRGALLASALCLGGMAQAQTTYNVAGLADFTGPFAERLNSLCAMEVREAKNGDSITPGLVLIAPGDYHMVVRRSGARY